MAHRQMAMARKDKQVQKDAKVPLETVIQDNSRQKETSHNQLKATISKFGDAVLGNLYSKAELVTLSKGYGLQLNSRANKAQLGKSRHQGKCEYTFPLESCSWITATGNTTPTW